MFHHSPIRLIALDLDGTALSPEGTITSFTYKAIRRALEQGIQVVICTGRNLPELQPIYDALPEVRYYAGANGGILWDRQTVGFLYENPLSFALQQKILHRTQGIDSMLELFTKEHIYCSLDSLKHLSRYVPSFLFPIIGRTRTPVEDIRAFILGRQKNALKINQFFPSEQERQKAAAGLADLELDCTSSIGCNLECNTLCANKGDALEHLAEYLHIPRQQVMAIGDGNNDLSMLRYAGFSVAMENGLEEVKKESQAITCSNREDGAAQAIVRYALEED